MKNFRHLSYFILLTGLVFQSAGAQVLFKRKLDDSKEGIFHLQELQALLSSQNDTVKILTVLPTEIRPDGYKDITIKENDEILMLNAKRLRSVKQFEEIYAGLEIGAVMKMGIRRNGELFMESFTKIDPDDLPKDRKIKMHVAASEDSDEHSEGGVVKRIIKMDSDSDDSEELRLWMGTGLVLGYSDDKIKVMDVLEDMADALGDADIAKDDVIESLNNKKLSSLDQLFEMYEKIKSGDKVQFSYLTNGIKKETSFVKKNLSGKVIMRKN